MTIRAERVRRTAGAVLVGVGVLLLGFAASHYVGGAVGAAEARERWHAGRARLAVQAIRSGSDAAYGTHRLARGAPVARLVIPRIGLDEIVVEGVGNEELNVGPGHLPGSVLPGERGNAVISAHRDRHFMPLGELEVGDTVRTEVGYRTTSWVVVSRRVVSAGAPALFAAAAPTLTLTTCWPIRYFGPAPDRLVVTAKPVERGGAPDRS